MKSIVNKLADLELFRIPEELKDSSVSEEEVTSSLEALSKKNAQTVSLPAYEEGCTVVCDDAGSALLLFPALGMPGMEEAEKAAKAAALGDVLTVTVGGKEKTVTVKEFLINCPVEISDKLAEVAGIEGVTTLEELKANIIATTAEKKKVHNVSEISRAYMAYLNESSEVSIDEEEQEAFAAEKAVIIYKGNLEFGFDMRITEEGEMITEEEAIERLKPECRQQFTAMLINRKIAEIDGFVPDEEAIKAQLMGEEVSEEQMADIIDNEYYGHAYQMLQQKALEVLG